MDWLDEELRRALAREEPPDGFAERVLARSRHASGGSGHRWLAAAAMVVIAVGAGGAWREHEGNRAKRELMLAVRLASAPVYRIQSEIKDIGQ